jgi:hypothetical protein
MLLSRNTSLRHDVLLWTTFYYVTSASVHSVYIAGELYRFDGLIIILHMAIGCLVLRHLL